VLVAGDTLNRLKLSSPISLANMHLHRQQKFFLVLSFPIVVAMGFLFKYYTGPFQQWFNNNGAAIFYEVFWCLFTFCFYNHHKAVSQIPIWVFLLTCFLEFLQLWHPPLLVKIRATFIGRLLLGSVFSWWDFPHYALGSGLGWLWLRKLQKINYAKKS
jgi:hypothetical protein